MEKNLDPCSFPYIKILIAEMLPLRHCNSQASGFRKPEMAWAFRNLASHFTERGSVYHNLITGN